MLFNVNSCEHSKIVSTFVVDTEKVPKKKQSQERSTRLFFPPSDDVRGAGDADTAARHQPWNTTAQPKGLYVHAWYATNECVAC